MLKDIPLTKKKMRGCPLILESKKSTDSASEVGEIY